MYGYLVLYYPQVEIKSYYGKLSFRLVPELQKLFFSPTTADGCDGANLDGIVETEPHNTHTHGH